VDGTDWQKRSGDAALRETFMITGISKPLTHGANLYSFVERAFVACRAGRQGFSTKPLIAFFEVSQRSFLTNKLSLNLLQDRLACTSHPSLKGVIATNLVVNPHAKSGQITLAQAQHQCTHRRPSQTRARLRYNNLGFLYVCSKE
jgi:hypothetical protein